jgi:hypothetical protein
VLLLCGAAGNKVLEFMGKAKKTIIQKQKKHASSFWSSLHKSCTVLSAVFHST